MSNDKYEKWKFRLEIADIVLKAVFMILLLILFKSCGDTMIEAVHEEDCEVVVTPRNQSEE